ncbi:MAG: glycoside hydrolase family 92 protein, partial [Prevotella sp.]|nr:glycoside hydrolase family 92 protein [Prevotella sp.]
MKSLFLFVGIMAFLPLQAEELTSKVNPLLGTATLWTPEDLGYTHTEAKRAWGAEVFPGAALPNAMVQATPVTMYRSGAGYQYEDHQIYGFAHTAKGHWNLLHLPVLPVTGRFEAHNFCSWFNHENEEAHPG